MRFIAAIILIPFMLFARDIYVSANNGNDANMGTREEPLESLAVGVSEARNPGDTVILLDGPFKRPLKTYHDGNADKPITIRPAEGVNIEIIYGERALQVNNDFIHIVGLVFDGGENPDGTLTTIQGNNVVLKNCEIRNGNRDLLSIGDVRNIRIEDCRIHHGLSWHSITRKEPHGISTRGVKGLKVINTEIYQITGDCIQISPSRDDWDDIELRDCTFWVAPLTKAEVRKAGLPPQAVGSIQAENALDLKSDKDDAPQKHRIKIINCTAYGWRSTRIKNAAAFNIKNPTVALVDGCTVYDSEIAFRLREPAQVDLQNSVVYDCDFGVRYEDGMKVLRIWHNTFGLNVGRALREVGPTPKLFEATNNLFVAGKLPKEIRQNPMMRGANMALPATEAESWFMNPAKGDYRLKENAPAIDSGIDMDFKKFSHDKNKNTRPAGKGYDLGAYEKQEF